MSRPALDSKNISMSRPTLEYTPNVFNTKDGTMSSIDSIPIRTKTPKPTLLTQPTKFPEKNGNAHVPDDPDPDPSISDSLSKKKKRNKKKNRRKYMKDD